MNTTIKEYLENPMGKGDASIPNRQLVISDLIRRYEKLLQKNNFKPSVYERNGEYFIHFNIPSESARENNYDVVIQFEDEKGELKFDNFIDRYKLRLFSNCPAFTFTYAYVYNDNDMMVKFLRKKYDEIVLSDSPSMRNPKEIISFEKSTYFACLYLKEHKQYMNKMYLRQMSGKFDERLMFSKIRNTKTIMQEIEKENTRIKEEKALKSEETRRKTKNVERTHAEKPIQKTTSLGNATGKIAPMKKITPKAGKKKIH